MKRMFLLAATALILAAPTVSASQRYGFAAGNISLRSGPDIDYPAVAVIPEGSELEIQGCTQGWEWCDVIVGDVGDRGWVAGSYIAYNYNDRPVLVSEYGGRVGLPIISFSIGNYWDRYYRHRPFYVERERWYRRPYVRRPAPSPFVGWNLRFGINGRDYHRWHDRGDYRHDGRDRDHNWDREHYRNPGRDRKDSHGRVYPLPHPTPDHRRIAPNRSTYNPARNQGVPKPAQRFGPNKQQPYAQPKKINNKVKVNNKVNNLPKDSRKKDVKDHDQRR